MKRTSRYVLTLMLVVATCAGSGFASGKPTRPAGSASLVPLPASAASNTPDSSATPRPPQDFGTHADPSQLVVTRSVEIGSTTVTRVQQRVNGLDVIGGEAVVVGTPGARPRTFTDATHDLIATPPAATVSREAAIDAAMRAGRVAKLRAAPDGVLAILPEGTGSRIVWRISIASARPLADLESLVDAVSGAVVRSMDLLAHDTATALVYDPNPVVAQQSYAGLKDRRDKDSPLLDSLRRPVTLDHLAPGSSCLDGTFVRALTTKAAHPVCNPTHDFSAVTRSNDSFEALMAYFHIDRLQTYIQSLGFPNVNNRQIRVVADAIRDDNSFFSPVTGALDLGRGGVDDGEDADVIAHEYGHAIQDDQIGRLQSHDAKALGEGFGDYVAAMASAELSPGTTLANDVCIFEWDATASSKHPSACTRRANSKLTLAEAARGCHREIHCLGTVWSSSLFRLRQALGDDATGRSVMDRVIIASHFLETPDVDFAGAAHAVECADDMLYPAGVENDCSGAHIGAIHAEFVTRGIL